MATKKTENPYKENENKANLGVHGMNVCVYYNCNFI